ncbi:MAG: beta-ketoacyl synthase chain length factor [Desulfovibrio sp.]|nr:beta-ketoacyl synthase chain length factor [Desulfovibrio sp.]
MTELFDNALSVLGTGAVHSLGQLAGLLDLRLRDAAWATSQEIPGTDTSQLAQIFPKLSLRRVPRAARTCLLATGLALQDASICPEVLKIPGRTGIFVGTAFSSATTSMDFMDSILDGGPKLSSPTAFSHSVSNVEAGMLSLLLGIQGPCMTVTQFALSFAGALASAQAQLNSGRIDLALCGAMEERDARFADVCSATNYSAQAPVADGAVFFVLARHKPGTPCLASGFGTPPAFVAPLRGEGALGVLFGQGSLAQAIDAATMLAEANTPAGTIAKDSHSGLEGHVIYVNAEGAPQD